MGFPQTRHEYSFRCALTADTEARVPPDAAAAAAFRFLHSVVRDTGCLAMLAAASGSSKPPDTKASGVNVDSLPVVVVDFLTCAMPRLSSDSSNCTWSTGGWKIAGFSRASGRATGASKGTSGREIPCNKILISSCLLLFLYHSRKVDSLRNGGQRLISSHIWLFITRARTELYSAKINFQRDRYL